MRIAVALAATLAGCYAPNPHAGIECGGAARACPDGLTCRLSTNTCETTGDGGGSDGPATRDAPDADAPIVIPDAAAPDAPSTPAATLRQQIEGANNGGTTLTVSLPQLPLAGDVLVMVGGNPSGALTGVTGGGIAAWALATQSTANVNIEIWYGTVDNTGIATDITITRINGSAPNSMWVGEFQHLVAAAPLDQAKALDGITSPASAGAVMTTHDHELELFGVADGFPNTFGASPTAGTWTAGDPLTGSIATTQQVWFRNIGLAGTWGASVTETSHDWDAALATFVRGP